MDWTIKIIFFLVSIAVLIFVPPILFFFRIRDMTRNKERMINSARDIVLNIVRGIPGIGVVIYIIVDFYLFFKARLSNENTQQETVKDSRDKLLFRMEIVLNVLFVTSAVYILYVFVGIDGLKTMELPVINRAIVSEARIEKNTLEYLKKKYNEQFIVKSIKYKSNLDHSGVFELKVVSQLRPNLVFDAHCFSGFKKFTDNYKFMKWDTDSEDELKKMLEPIEPNLYAVKVVNTVNKNYGKYIYNYNVLNTEYDGDMELDSKVGNNIRDVILKEPSNVIQAVNIYLLRKPGEKDIENETQRVFKILNYYKELGIEKLHLRIYYLKDSDIKNADYLLKNPRNVLDLYESQDLKNKTYYRIELYTYKFDSIMSYPYFNIKDFNFSNVEYLLLGLKYIKQAK